MAWLPQKRLSTKGSQLGQLPCEPVQPLVVLEPVVETEPSESEDVVSELDEDVASQLVRLEQALADLKKKHGLKMKRTPEQKRLFYTRNPSGCREGAGRRAGCSVLKAKVSRWYLKKGKPEGRRCRTCKIGKANARNALFRNKDVD